MARPGVTQTQVDAAADALLKAGERPTIERVRASLGTGSPNTLIRFIDDWWLRLGERLAHVEATMAMPEAPRAAVEAAGSLWRIALEHAKSWAFSELEAERESLRSERSQMAREAEGAAQAVTSAQAAALQAEAALGAANTRVADLERLVAEQGARLADSHARLEDALQRSATAEVLTVRLSDELSEQRQSETRKLANLQAHIVSVEERAHAEVDRARQETKQAKKRIEVLEKVAEQMKRQLAERAEKAEAAARASEVELSRVRARLQAMEEFKPKISKAKPSTAKAPRRPSGRPVSGGRGRKVAGSQP